MEYPNKWSTWGINPWEYSQDLLLSSNPLCKAPPALASPLCASSQKNEAPMMSSYIFHQEKPSKNTFFFFPEWFLDSWQSPASFLLQKLFLEVFCSGNSSPGAGLSLFPAWGLMLDFLLRSPHFLCASVFSCLPLCFYFFFLSIPLGSKSLWAWTMWLIWAVF